MTEIYLVRHGQSEANILNLFAGQSGYALSALGHEQAKQTASFFADIPLDAVISSDLPRAFQTAEPIAVQHRLPLITDMRLREINAGDWEGIPFSEIGAKNAEAAACWHQNIGLSACPNGESLRAVLERVVPAAEDIARQYCEKRICLVMHATSLRVLECAWRGLPIERLTEVPWLCNASVSLWHSEPEGRKTCVFRDKTVFPADMVTALPNII